MADPASGASVVLQAPFHPVQILPDLAPASSFTSCLIIYDLGCQTIFFCISVWLFPLSEMPPFLRPYPNQVGAYSSYKLHLDAFSPENTPWPVHETNRCSTGIYWYSPPPPLVLSYSPYIFTITFQVSIHLSPSVRMKAT